MSTINQIIAHYRSLQEASASKMARQGKLEKWNDKESPFTSFTRTPNSDAKATSKTDSQVKRIFRRMRQRDDRVQGQKIYGNSYIPNAAYPIK